ncbi:MAG TPA: hypothetical protein PLY37_01620 [Candidatus Pacearchaeota archaeon]|nr:hypothetical protein [Candidatus Pacearchaeota archaeon]
MKQEIITKINNFWENPQTKKYFWGDWIDIRYYLCDQLSEFKNKKILDISCQTGVVIKCLDASNQIYGDNPYFKNKNKITLESLEKIFSGFDCKIFGWNSFPIQAQKILKYIPQIFEFLKYDMQNKKDIKKSVSFYVIATKNIL